MPDMRDNYPSLSRALLEKFMPSFAPGSVLCGEIGSDLISYGISGLAVNADDMPDVVLHDAAHNRLLLVDFAAHRGLIDEIRVRTLAQLFQTVKPQKVYVTVFQNRSSMAEYQKFPAWGTHAWFFDEPEHMIHFGGPFDRVVCGADKARLE